MGFAPYIIYTYKNIGRHKPFRYKLLIFSIVELYLLLDTYCHKDLYIVVTVKFLKSEKLLLIHNFNSTQNL